MLQTEKSLNERNGVRLSGNHSPNTTTNNNNYKCKNNANGRKSELIAFGVYFIGLYAVQCTLYCVWCVVPLKYACKRRFFTQKWYFRHSAGQSGSYFNFGLAFVVIFHFFFFIQHFHFRWLLFIVYIHIIFRFCFCCCCDFFLLMGTRTAIVH